MESKIKKFFDSNNYDVRVIGNGRWIDQKCMMDVLSLVSDCVLNYVSDDINKIFTTKDIWFSEYAITNVQKIFVKPDPTNKKSSREYDKYFGQPLKLLGYSGILKEEKKNNKNYYTVKNVEILDYIAKRDINALEFLQMYIEKVLKDSQLFEPFADFFNLQDKDSYENCKRKFTEFTMQYTNINKEVECGRIFAKVINPLAFKYKKYGTYKGHVSKNIITLDVLQYNQPNWRDLLSNKPKNITRMEYLAQLNVVLEPTGLMAYKIQRAKKVLRDFNKIRDSLPEVLDVEFHLKVKATQMHHIFPVAHYPDIADVVENLIALTPNQHNLQAHPNNNTQIVDKKYQHVCLIEKIERIKESFDSNLPSIYSFDELIRVLNTGLETDEFNKIEKNDFDAIIMLLDKFY